MAFITDEQAKQYLQSFKNSQKIDLDTIYPLPNEHGADLLEKMLKFNPLQRATVSECLEHPFFETV